MKVIWLSSSDRFVPEEGGTISHLNRSFLYGDGCFESMRAMGGKLLFAQAHFDRLTSGMKALGIEIPETFTPQMMEQRANELLAMNRITGGGRLRLTVWREAGGHYGPNDHKSGMLMTADLLPDDKFTLSGSDLALDIYPDMKKEVNAFANHKTTSCQLYVQGAIYASRHGLDDVLLVNQNGGIIESTNSNLFVVSNRVLYTPGLDRGCVAGTMRMRIINLALNHGLKVYECNISPQHLLAADELILTNAISGIRGATAYRTKRYNRAVADFLTQKLNEEIGAV